MDIRITRLNYTKKLSSLALWVLLCGWSGLGWCWSNSSAGDTLDINLLCSRRTASEELGRESVGEVEQPQSNETSLYNQLGSELNNKRNLSLLDCVVEWFKINDLSGDIVENGSKHWNFDAQGRLRQNCAFDRLTNILIL